MGSMNKAILIGNLGRDAELRYTPGGAAIAKFSIATTETWTDKSGQRQEKTEWHNCDLWGKSAESLSEYLKKGKQVAVEGRIQTDEYTDREGVKRKATKIRVDRLTLLGGGPGGRRREAGDEDGPHQPASDPGAPLDDSDIPF